MWWETITKIHDFHVKTMFGSWTSQTWHVRNTKLECHSYLINCDEKKLRYEISAWKKIFVSSLFTFFWGVGGGGGSRGGRDPMIVGFTTTYAISAYHDWRCEFEPHSGDKTLWDEVCPWLTTGRCQFSPVSSTNKTDRHDITEILLKVVLSTISLPPTFVLKAVCALFMKFIFIYVYRYPTWFPYQIMFVSISSNTMGVTSGAGTAYLSNLVFTSS